MEISLKSDNIQLPQLADSSPLKKNIGLLYPKTLKMKVKKTIPQALQKKLEFSVTLKSSV